MLRSLVPIVLGLVAIVVAIGIVFMIGMRTKSRWVLSAVRRLNRRFINPQQLRTAGTPGAYASVIRHRGRSSGRQYETPVGASPTADGFVIALPYGTQADWLRNVMAHGSATIVHDGATYDVDAPELVPIAAVIEDLPSEDKRQLRLFNVTQCLRLRRVTRSDADMAAERP
jgi:deazaflavin-dependent oxidoreductase (nitroreductase family)